MLLVILYPYTLCTPIYVVVNNAAMVDVGQDVIVNREGVQVTIDCIQLINNRTISGIQNPTVNWYKDGITITNGSAVNVAISNDDRLCIITSTLLTVDGQDGTDGNYTCEVCNGTTNCIREKSTHVVCGKKDYSESTIICIHTCYSFITYVGEPLIQEPQHPALTVSTSIVLTCGEDVTITSLVNVTTVSFLCNVSNGSQTLTWKVYKDGELTQYNSTPIVINNPTESDYGTYTFVLSSTHCGSAVKVSRFLQQGDFYVCSIVV